MAEVIIPNNLEIKFEKFCDGCNECKPFLKGYYITCEHKSACHDLFCRMMEKEKKE